MSIKRKKTQPTTDEPKPKGFQINYKPRSRTQTTILLTITNKDITFLTGVTGTGKTFLATVAGIRLLMDRKSGINKMVIIRPAVTAQEDIGFMPGDVNEKMAHFTAPVHEHIIKLVGPDVFTQLKEKNKIEIIPIAFLRGRNFENCFVILDEAQNTNKDQMILVLTRLAENSKIVICGDTGQCDVHENESGLVDAIPRFKDEKEFGFVSLPESEIQRHPLVRRILERYKADLDESIIETTEAPVKLPADYLKDTDVEIPPLDHSIINTPKIT